MKKRYGNRYKVTKRKQDEVVQEGTRLRRYLCDIHWIRKGIGKSDRSEKAMTTSAPAEVGRDQWSYWKEQPNWYSRPQVPHQWILTTLQVHFQSARIFLMRRSLNVSRQCLYAQLLYVASPDYPTQELCLMSQYSTSHGRTFLCIDVSAPLGFINFVRYLGIVESTCFSSVKGHLGTL